MFNYFYNLRRYFKFDKEEVRYLFSAVLLFTFVLGYNDDYEVFILSRWLLNLLTSFIISFSFVATKEIAHKLMAIKRGYTCRLKLWWPLFLVQIVFTIATQGKYHVVLPISGLLIFHHERMRIGEFRYGHSYFDNALIALSGPVANIYLAFFFKIFSFLPNPTIQLAMLMNIAYALVNLIPVDLVLIPFYPKKFFEHLDIRKYSAPFSGTYLFYCSLMFYIFAVSFVSIMSVSMFMMNIVAASIMTFIISIIAFFTKGFFEEFKVV